LGKWKTVDDTDGKTKSIVELYRKDGLIYGKVIDLLPEATIKVCNHCPGEKSGKTYFKWILSGILENLEMNVPVVSSWIPRPVKYTIVFSNRKKPTS